MLLVNKHRFVYFISVVAFTLDCIINYKYDMPFMTGAIFLLLLYVISNIKITQYVLMLLYFVIAVFLNMCFTDFSVKDISDLLYILLFLISITYYIYIQQSLTERNMFVLLLFSLFLLSFSFVGVEASNVESTISAVSNDLEFKREYHQGLFRISHVASYFFYFIAIYTMYLSKNVVNSFKYVLITIISLGFVLYIGSRTPIAIFMISLIFFYMNIKRIFYFVLIVISLAFLYLNIDIILDLFDKTVFYQYFSIISTLSNNIGRLSRVMIWSSWYNEMINSSSYQILFGHSFYSSFLANNRNIGSLIWFHNDFLSIIYAYGVFGFIIYLFGFIKLYMISFYKRKKNFFVFTFFVSMFFAAFFNGFYYYQPFFLLSLYFYMLKIEVAKSQL